MRIRRSHDLFFIQSNLPYNLIIIRKVKFYQKKEEKKEMYDACAYFYEDVFKIEFFGKLWIFWKTMESILLDINDLIYGRN